jgi:2-C-methyl-D-erythritol 4-phosphate cytidylyltransferase
MKVSVIIPAAGLGTRMATAPASKTAKPKKSAPSKQFTDLGGTPIVVHTLRRFAKSPEVNEIVVALRKAEIAPFRARLEKEAPEILAKKTVLLEGGESRQQSVGNGLAAVSASAHDDDIVLVHDAVRPFVTREQLDRVIEEARTRGAAILGIPAIDTVKEVKRASLPQDVALITTTIPRERVVLAQTPQVFSYALLRDAFRAADKDGIVGSDESSLVERFGHDVYVVLGSERNFKITRPADMDLARFYLQQERAAK